MDKGLAVFLMAVVGGLIALQAPINAGLGKATGSFAAALVSFAIGTLALTAIVVLSGKAGGVSEAANVKWYYLLGGLLGAAYVFTGAGPGGRDRRRRRRGGHRHRPADPVGRARPPRRPRPRARRRSPGSGCSAWRCCLPAPT